MIRTTAPARRSVSAGECLRERMRDERGASLLEYVLIVGLIAIVAFVAFKTFGSNLFAKSSGDAKTVLCIPGDTQGAAAGDCTAANPGGGGGGCLGGLCAGPGKCFVAGTPVLTPHGLVPIESVHEGDLVVSRDERTGEVVAETVLRTFLRTAPSLLDLRVGDPGGNEETIRVTPGHLIWTLDGGWKEAGSLTTGESLDDVHGHVLRVVSSMPLDEEAPVYNFEVSETHTYFVGALALWVHNNPTVLGNDPEGNPVYGSPSQPARPSQYPIVVYTGSDPTYRADSRKPKIIFEQGFQPRYSGKASLEGHVIDHNPGPWISTSTGQNGAGLFGQPGDYIYTIESGNGVAIDTNATMGPHKYSHQNEVTYYGGIPNTQIIGAQKVGSDGKPGKMKPNPNYPGNQGGGGTSCVLM